MQEWEVASTSHIGGRDENQDRLAAFQDKSVNFIIVADGMGGHENGSLAAEIIIQTAGSFWDKRNAYDSPEGFLDAFIKKSHYAVLEAGKNTSTDPHSTVVALWLTPEFALSAHAGDSRVIQFGDKGFIKRTIDHSVAELHVLKGTITEEEMATHPDQKKVFTNIGDSEEPETEFTHWDLSEGQFFTICSDGFWEIINNDNQTVLFNDSINLQSALNLLVSKSIDQASEDHDNSTAVIIRPKIISSKSAPTSPDQTPKTNPVWLQLMALAIVTVAAALYFTLINSKNNSPINNSPPSSPQDKKQEAKSKNDNLEAISLDPIPSEIKRLTSILDEGKDSDEEPTNRLPPLDQQTNIPIDPNNNEGAIILQWLQQQNLLGDNDALTIKSKLSGNQDRRLIRYQQQHNGIEVDGSNITIIIKKQTIHRVMARLGKGIKLSNAQPMSFEDALHKVNITHNENYVLDGKKSLLIYKVATEYILVWRAEVAGSIEEEIIINASNGNLVSKAPVIISGANKTKP